MKAFEYPLKFISPRSEKQVKGLLFFKKYNSSYINML